MHYVGSKGVFARRTRFLRVTDDLMHFLYVNWFEIEDSFFLWSEGIQYIHCFGVIRVKSFSDSFYFGFIFFAKFFCNRS